MSRQFTCACANCQKTTVPVIFTMPDERSRFCCADHAAVAMVRRAWIAAHGEKADELMRIEKALRALIGDGNDVSIKPQKERPADMRDSPLRDRS